MGGLIDEMDMIASVDIYMYVLLCLISSDQKKSSLSDLVYRVIRN